MSHTTYEIWCFLEGDNTTFPVTISSDNCIHALKEFIKLSKSKLIGVDASNLFLWKIDVHYNEETHKKVTARQYRPTLPTLGPNGDVLNPMKRISEVWPGPPPSDHIHVFVCQPPTRTCVPGEVTEVGTLRSSRQLSTLFPLDPPKENISIVVKVRDLAPAIPRWSTPLDDDRRPAKRLRFSDQKLSDPFDEENTVPDNRPLFHTPTKPIAEVKDSIHNILEPYSRTMHVLVTKAGREPLIPLWAPKAGSNDVSDEAFRSHIETLAIPDVHGMPSLLLHELGSKISICQQQAQYIDLIFTSKDHTVLINTSGSGKTRLGLHGLCQYWGFYGIVNQASDDIGSGDFWELMSTIDESLNYDRAKLLGSHNEQAAQHMEQTVKHRVMQFLLARFLLLNLLVSEASECEGGLRLPDHRILWVLLQARPTDMFKKDPFIELANALRMASIADLEEEIKLEYSIFESTLKHATGADMDRPLYCFLDEVQVTTALRMGEHRSHDAAEERPLLRPIWEKMTAVLNSTQMLTILSGTALNEKSLKDVSNSSVFKAKNYNVVNIMGAFDDPGAQRQYIEHYLAYEPSAAKEAFLKRAWVWCRGRYRSTAMLVASVLADGPRSPHKILNRSVETSTNFLPTDGDVWCANENELPKIFNFNVDKLRGWNFDRLNSQQIKTLRYVLYEQIVYGSYTLSSNAPQKDIKTFIEYGIARTKSEKTDVIDEPLAIMAAWDWLDSDDRAPYSLLDSLQDEIEKHAPRKNGFEAYLAFYVRKALEESTKLNNLFTFRSDFSLRKYSDLSWQEENFELVTVSISEDTNQQAVSVVTPSSGPSSNVGFLAETDEDVLNWISQNQGCYAFCFPTESAGPDIFFYLRSKQTGRILLVAVQAKRYKVVDKATLVQGVRTVTPPFWERKAKKADEISDGPPDIPSRFFDALMKTENKITIKNARYPILRVFASWEGDAKLERTLDLKDPEGHEATKSRAASEDSVDVSDDAHPLATLHLENFVTISRSLAKSSFRGDKDQVVVFAEQLDDGKPLRRSKRIQLRT